jgi:hypothetical protein
MAEKLSLCGTVGFQDGNYLRLSGSDDWTVVPIAGFGAPVGPPLGQVRINFKDALSGPYTVLVSALRLSTTPMLTANYGNADETGFVVHLFEPVASHTLQNGGFSFMVCHE